MGASSLIVLAIAAVAFSGIAILVSKFVVKATTNKQKGEPYECGIPTQGPSWIQFNVGYYLFALIFLICAAAGFAQDKLTRLLRQPDIQGNRIVFVLSLIHI